MVTAKWKYAFIDAWDAPDSWFFDVNLGLTHLVPTWHYWFGARRCYPQCFSPGFRRHRLNLTISVGRGVEGHRAPGRPRRMSESGTNSLTPGLITLHHLPAAAGGRPVRPSSQGQSRGRLKNASVCVHACFGGSVAADFSAQSPPGTMRLKRAPVGCSRSRGV